MLNDDIWMLLAMLFAKPFYVNFGIDKLLSQFKPKTSMHAPLSAHLGHAKININ